MQNLEHPTTKPKENTTKQILEGFYLGLSNKEKRILKTVVLKGEKVK